MTDLPTTEDRVAAHYSDGRVLTRILTTLAADGVDIDHLTTSDLQSFDEFHVGGVVATRRLADQLTVPNAARMLDVGCGLGGPARFFAERFGARVDGIDLTPEYVEVGNELSARAGLADQVELIRANALGLPSTTTRSMRPRCYTWV